MEQDPEDKQRDEKPKKKKRHFTKWVKRNEPFFRLLEMALLVLAFGLGIWNLWSSAKFSQNVENHLKSLDTLFANVEHRIDALPYSVNKFDSTIQNLRKVVESQQKELSSSIGGLRTDVDRFSNSLVSYEKKLSEIVQASDKQLLLLKKTQALWEEEVSRKPDLKLVPEKVQKIEENKFHVFLAIANFGNQIAKETAIILEVPKRFNLKSSGWTYGSLDSLADPQEWNYEVKTSFIGYYSSPVKVLKTRPPNFDFTIEIPFATDSFPLKLKYIVFYSRGSQEGMLIVKYP
jgi:hypothetical protein